jgi:hypothetical protein
MFLFAVLIACRDGENPAGGATDDSSVGPSDDSGASDDSATNDDSGGSSDDSATIDSDADDDGYDADADCDDGDPGVNPGAEELCNDVDDDCDTDVDEGVLLTSYVDSDGDGTGDPDTAGEGCDVPKGHVLVGGDCDDGDPLRSPNIAEACNEIDDDCDGMVDFGVRVPLDYADLAEAVDATSPGGTICIGEGTFAAGIVLENDVTIVGGGPSVTTLTSDGASRTLTFAEITANVSNLTLDPGYEGTVEMWESTVAMQDIGVDELDCNDTYCQGAFAMMVTSDLTIDGLVGDGLEATSSSDYYGVFFLGDDTAELTISNMAITDGRFGSTGSSTWGAIVCAPVDARVEISDTLFQENEFFASSWLYGATYAIDHAYTDVSFVDNEFDAPSVLVDYTMAYGAFQGSHVLFADNRVSYTNHHYGFYTLAGTISIANSIFAGNEGNWTGSGNGYGRGLVSNNQGSLTLTNVDFVGNSLDGGIVDAAGIWATGGASTWLTNVSFASNAIDGDFDEEASCFKDEGSSTLSYVNTYDNDGGYGDLRNSSASLTGTSLTTGDPTYTSLSGDAATWDLHPMSGSALEDAGDPGMTDADGSTADIGAYGGPDGAW